ncbi:MAG: hypothetical protein AAGB24_13350 [Bacteroidota bacterium]
MLSLVLFFIGFLEAWFIKEDHNSFSVNYSKDKVERIDIGIFGTSHGYTAFDPRVFEKNIGVPTYNFSFTAQRLIAMSPFIDDVTTKYDFKLAVIDVCNLSSDSLPNPKAKGFQYLTFDNTRLSLSKVGNFNKVYGYDNMFEVFPTIRNHTKWKEFLDSKPTYTIPLDRDFYKGFRSYFSHSKEAWDEHVKKFKWPKKKYKVNKDGELDADQKQKYLEVISKLEKKNIDILFTSAPVYQKALKPHYWAYLFSVQKFLDSLGFELIDYNSLYDELELKKKHFRDPSHLNSNGAVIVSEHLAKYIRNNFDFKKPPKDSFDKENNRYFLIDKNKKNALYHKRFGKNSKIGSLGINGAILYKVFDDRYELVIQGRKRVLDKSRFKLSFDFPKTEARKVVDEKYLLEDQNRLVYNEKFENWIDYKGKSFHVFQFNAPFSELNNFELKVGSGNKVFKEDTLKLKP